MPRVRDLPPFGNTCYVLEKQIPSSTIEIQQAERERIILEIHDGPAQTLASALQYLQTIDQIAHPHFDQHRDLDQLFARAVGLVEQAIQETRKIISGAIPVALDVHGLVLTVRQELKQFGRETGCHVEFYSKAWPNLPPHVEFTIYRIIREAVNNVRKHAQASRLEVEMTEKRKRLLIRVKDWGIGFIPDRPEPSSSSNSLGLLSMRRRTELLGGTFKINSVLGKGTEIQVNIPYKTEPG
jgi:two-component system sensor histidine kinase DegS